MKNDKDGCHRGRVTIILVIGDDDDSKKDGK